MWGSYKSPSDLCFAAGFASIAAAIAIWFLAKTADPAHGERFGLFVGLWAPTFFSLSNRLETCTSRDRLLP